MRFLRAAAGVLHDAGQGFARDNGTLLSGAIAFYAMLTTAPLLVVAVAIAGFVVGEDVAREELRTQFEGPLGSDAAGLLAQIMQQAAQPASGWWATVASLAFLGFAASRLFAHLQTALNQIWGVVVLPQGLKRSAAKLLRKRLLAFIMVLVSGFLLTSLLFARMLVVALAGILAEVIPMSALLLAVEQLVSLGILTSLFAIIYKILPDVRIAWRDVWIGSFITAVLMGLGTLPIGWYLRTAGIGSTYGAAGSLVVLLVWVYYSAHIFFFGAELIGALARRFGAGIEPESYATRLPTPAAAATAE